MSGDVRVRSRDLAEGGGSVVAPSIVSTDRSPPVPRIRRGDSLTSTSSDSEKHHERRGGLDARGCRALFNLLIRGHGYRDGNILRADPKCLVNYVADSLRWGWIVIRFIGCEDQFIWSTKRDVQKFSIWRYCSLQKR
jgi:hypothetical protein